MTAVAGTTPSYVRRERPEPAAALVQRRSQDGTVLSEVVLPPEIFGIEPNVPLLHQVVTAQLAAAAVGHPDDEDPGRGRGRWRQAVPPEGHRQRSTGLDPRATLGRRWCGPRPEAPQLRPAHAQEDDPPGPALRLVGPGERRAHRARRAVGPSRPPRPRTPWPPLGRARGERPRARGPRATTMSPPTARFANLPEIVRPCPPAELTAYDVLRATGSSSPTRRFRARPSRRRRGGQAGERHQAPARPPSQGGDARRGRATAEAGADEPAVDRRCRASTERRRRRHRRRAAGTGDDEESRHERPVARPGAPGHLREVLRADGRRRLRLRRRPPAIKVEIRQAVE